MGGIGAIVEGFYNNALNKKEDMYLERIRFCHNCELLAVDSFFGEICNNHLWVNPNTNEVSEIPKEGFRNGCGCVLRAKCRVPTDECPLGKWKKRDY